jgi:hypothetical protein
MTWVLILWCVIILIWAIAGGSSSNHQAVQNCVSGGFVSQSDCQNAANAGTGIGVALILLIGFVGFVFFSLIWFMTRPRGRTCPTCGETVKRGMTTCASCGYDFARAAESGAYSSA